LSNCWIKTKNNYYYQNSSDNSNTAELIITHSQVVQHLCTRALYLIVGVVPLWNAISTRVCVTLRGVCVLWIVTTTRQTISPSTERISKYFRWPIDEHCLHWYVVSPCTTIEGFTDYKMVTPITKNDTYSYKIHFHQI
jgi:hypothetical protein